jgi:hypothetical protein
METIEKEKTTQAIALPLQLGSLTLTRFFFGLIGVRFVIVMYYLQNVMPAIYQCQKQKRTKASEDKICVGHV